MIHKLAALVFAALIALPACATKPPRQVEAPDALNDKGADMSTGEDSSGNIKTTGEKSGADQMHEKCCGECKVGLSKDRSGGKAETIPCADFTSDLSAICLEHFRGKKTMASECK